MAALAAAGQESSESDSSLSSDSSAAPVRGEGVQLPGPAEVSKQAGEETKAPSRERQASSVRETSATASPPPAMQAAQANPGAPAQPGGAPQHRQQSHKTDNRDGGGHGRAHLRSRRRGNSRSRRRRHRHRRTHESHERRNKSRGKHGGRQPSRQERRSRSRSSSGRPPLLRQAQVTSRSSQTMTTRESLTVDKLDELKGKGVKIFAHTLQQNHLLFIPTGWVSVEQCEAGCGEVCGVRKSFFPLTLCSCEEYNAVLQLFAADGRSVGQMGNILKAMRSSTAALNAS